jgi:cell division septation protein DedD
VSDEKKEASKLSVQTLLISSVAAVVATVVVSQFWERGTLFFTAMVPIAVAIVTEALRRPAEKITQVAPLVAPLVVPKRTASGTDVHEHIPEEARRTFPEAEEPPHTHRKDRFGLYEDEPRRGSFLRSRGVRVGLVTGLIAFLIGAAVVTASELALFDGSVGGGDRRTTLLGGSSSRATTDDADETPTPTATPTGSATPEATATPESGERATPTPTPSATATPTPTTTATPAPTPGAAAPGATPTPAP